MPESIVLRVAYEDIWNFHSRGSYVVVTTNVGWKKSGEAVMGAGIAKEASVRYPAIPAVLGSYMKRCVETGEGIPELLIHRPYRLVLLATKPLNPEFPWLSWKNPADPGLIQHALLRLLEQVRDLDIAEVAIPLLGAGHGGLDPRESERIIREALRGAEERFVLVKKGKKDVYGRLPDWTLKPPGSDGHYLPC
jgi:hypothetical protein